MIVVCSGCGRKIKAPDERAGQIVLCPVCGESVAIVAAVPVEAPASTAEADDYIRRDKRSRKKYETLCGPLHLITATLQQRHAGQQIVEEQQQSLTA